jgi:hypothetical protein
MFKNANKFAASGTMVVSSCNNTLLELLRELREVNTVMIIIFSIIIGCILVSEEFNSFSAPFFTDTNAFSVLTFEILLASAVATTAACDARKGGNTGMLPEMSEIISTQKAPQPVGAYPHARRVGNLLFLSGIGPRTPDTNEIPGLKEVHAVDAAGVHPLLLAIGSERYTPYLQNKKPAEILTIANHILGTGQLSLAKFVFITADDSNQLSTHNVPAYLQFLLERIDLNSDIHFYTKTTMDTLDYSGENLNANQIFLN